MTTGTTYEVICDVEIFIGKSLSVGNWVATCGNAQTSFNREEQQFTAEASDLAIFVTLDMLQSVRLDFGFAKITFVPAVTERVEGEIVSVTFRGLNSETSLVIFND